MSDEEVEDLIACELQRDVRYSVAEHEILISFNNDDGAYAFHEWWNSVGQKQFVDWVKKEDRFSNT